VRLGLIGLGYIGKIHLRHCLNLESVELVAVSDLSKKALNFAKRMGAKKTLSKYQQLLEDPSIDAVIIALPTYLHASCAKSAAEIGKDILVEKPLARNVTEAREIISMARRNDSKVMVGYDMRFSPPFCALKEKIESGILGDVQIAYASNIGAGPFFHRAELGMPKPVPTWWFQKELTGGGALMDLGCHIINLFRWYFGGIASIRSYLGYRYNLDIEDQATCIARFISGPVAVINVGWFSQESQKKVELFGTVRHAIACRTAENRVLAAMKLLATRSTQYESTYLRELQYFVHCVKHDLPPSPSGNDALKDLEAISLAYKNQISLK